LVFARELLETVKMANRVEFLEYETVPVGNPAGPGG
jgi:hypothetical protein